MYIETSVVHDTSFLKTTGTFVVNIAEISLAFSVIPSTNSLVEKKKKRQRKKQEKKKRGERNLFFFFFFLPNVVSAEVSEDNSCFRMNRLLLSRTSETKTKRYENKEMEEKYVECQSKLERRTLQFMLTSMF